VIEILEGVVRARPELLEEPPPLVLFDRFGESSLDFLVRVWTSDLERFRSQQSRLAVDIYRALREAGIQIPFPQRDVHVRSLAPGLQDALQATGDAASAQAPPPPAPPRGAG
jgi:small-conductance mechanosensitive channel